MKKNFLLLLVILCPILLSAQWTSYFKNEKAEISYKYIDCHDNVNGIHQQKIVLKFQNFTNEKITVSFSKKLSYQNTGETKTDKDFYSVSLDSLQSIEGNCESKDKNLYIFVKMLNTESKTRALTKFELTNINIK